MDCTSTRLPYRQAGKFSKIVTDYIGQADNLKPFYVHTPSPEGVKAAIEARSGYATNREVLVATLKEQYGELATDKIAANITALVSPNTFTITTAHQPNILTGPLYFIYKIVHAIKLAEELEKSMPAYRFVPVYYMGSEDADLDELGHIHLNGVRLTWNTRQTGAVGRMKIDQEFLQVIAHAEGQLAVMPYGNEVLSLIKDCYKKGTTIQDATFRFVHALFAEYGLIVLIPDNAALKKQAIALFKDDLLHQQPSSQVSKTIEKLEQANYKVQANPREINLFYLKDDIRERIVKKGDDFHVLGKDIVFSETDLLKELNDHPERFSPNVILRGIFQEMILPNIAFIGGGGELAYWLQYGDLFRHYAVPFPLLVLRNSFLIVEKNWEARIDKLGFAINDLFLDDRDLLTKLVQRETQHQISLNGSITQVEALYESFKKQAGAIDTTLTQHVEALKTKALQRLQQLEKKMLRAEKRKFSDAQRQIHTIKSALFPGNGLQERYDNMLYYYAKGGRDFIRCIHRHSLALEQEFVILAEK